MIVFVTLYDYFTENCITDEQKYFSARLDSRRWRLFQHLDALFFSFHLFLFYTWRIHWWKKRKLWEIQGIHMRKVLIRFCFYCTILNERNVKPEQWNPIIVFSLGCKKPILEKWFLKIISAKKGEKKYKINAGNRSKRVIKMKLIFDFEKCNIYI